MDTLSPEAGHGGVREAGVAEKDSSFWPSEDHDSHTLRRFNEAPQPVLKIVLFRTVRFQPGLSKAGLRKIRLHDLRHVRLAADPERSLGRVRERADGP